MAALGAAALGAAALGAAALGKDGAAAGSFVMATAELNGALTAAAVLPTFARQSCHWHLRPRQFGGSSHLRSASLESSECFRAPLQLLLSL